MSTLTFAWIGWAVVALYFVVLFVVAAAVSVAFVRRKVGWGRWLRAVGVAFVWPVFVVVKFIDAGRGGSL